MQAQSSKIGRPRKIISQGSAKISFTGKNVTAHAGMVLVTRDMEAFRLRAQFGAICAGLDARTRLDTAKMIEQLITLRLLGGEANSDMALLDEKALKAIFDWDAIAHRVIFSRRLKRFDWRRNEGLQQVLGGLYRRLEPTGQRLVSIDSTVATVFGEQQGAELGYNPHKPGRLSYHPLLAVDVEARAVVDGFLRPGGAGGANGLEGFVRKIVADHPELAEDMVFRLDRGPCSGKVLDTIEALRCGYVAKFKLVARIAGCISKIRNWRSLGSGIFAASFRYQPRG